MVDKHNKNTMDHTGTDIKEDSNNISSDPRLSDQGGADRINNISFWLKKKFGRKMTDASSNFDSTKPDADGDNLIQAILLSFFCTQPKKRAPRDGDSADQLIHCPYAKIRHDMTHFFGNQQHVVHDVFRFAFEAFAECFILGGDAERTCVL